MQPGIDELDLDDESDTSCDWDERCHGPQDSTYNREHYPDGFIYECCAEDGTSTGCKWGRHWAVDDP